MNYTKSLILAIAAAGILSAPAFAATQTNKEKAIKAGKITLKAGVAATTLASALFTAYVATPRIAAKITSSKGDALLLEIMFAIVWGSLITSATYVSVKSAQSAIQDVKEMLNSSHNRID